MISAAVLAAGSGTRFGGSKQLATLGGKPLVQHAVDAARGAGIEDVVVVVGDDGDAVAAAVHGARIVVNRAPSAGQSTSLIAALDALGDDVDAVVVLLADQPGITADIVAALLAAARHRHEPVVRIRFADGPGPALLRRETWDELRTLSGDVGARALIEARPDLVFDAPAEGGAPPDVDTPADLVRAAVDRARRLRDPPAHEAGNEKPPSF